MTPLLICHSLSAIEFDEALPVNARRDEIAAAIAAHPVVVVCGETGSGKTTQLPKICLSIGRGLAGRGLIGHTQPRRIAARATAARIAQELKTELGREVGFKIRFTDRVSKDSVVKLMTDGILLAETQGDPLLRQYDTLLIDEAHERSLNIDFLLGYVKQLLPRRPDLKVIVTSATLDAERFSRHFEGAPVIEVSGRLHPIETRYRPFGEHNERDERDIGEAIADAVDEAWRHGPGDVLVFLPGEREIREAAEALRKHTRGPYQAGLEILSLFARQSAAEQGRVFTAHQGRRVVLATNVAETSLTVPGIRYVIDTGLARIKRYSHRNKVEQLQVEPISQAAAKQRAGRCGRVAAGVCLRLYSEEDLQKRPPYTEPEILRASLAGVILRMKALHLGDVEDFPFLEAPAPRRVADGYQVLHELGAVDEARALTPVGVALAKLPVDPKVGRMILAAREGGCLAEMLIIAAALSVQDPRERPPEQAASADQMHALWRDEKSEFLFWIKLWRATDELWKRESTNKQRQWCRRHFISWLRLREWRDTHGQLAALCHEHGWAENSLPADYAAIHKALLAGLLGQIGLKSEEEAFYRGPREIRFFIHPGSTLIKKAGRWIMAAEIVETSRLYARCVAKIEPEWLEQVGAHLVRSHVFDPHWEKGSGNVAAWERVTLHGLLLHGKRRVLFGGAGANAEQKKEAREILIRSALVQGEVGEDWARRWRFFQHNQKLLRDIEALEHKARRPDVLVDEALIHAFYDALLPPDITTLAAFDRWRIALEIENPRALYLEREQLMRHEAAGITTEAFPHTLELRGQSFALAYRHDPGAADDGVTLSLPLTALNQIEARTCEWLVPGLLKEKVLALLKTLPQKYRHRAQPLDAFAQAFCDEVHDTDETLVGALTRFVEERIALKLPLDAFRPGELRPHGLMNFRLMDEHGGTLMMSRSLPELRARHGARVEQSFAAANIEPADAQGEFSGLTDWRFGELPELMEVEINGQRVVGFPALVDEGASVALRVFDSPDKAREKHRAGLLRLFALALKEQLKFIEKNLPRELGMAYLAFGTERELKDQLINAALDVSCMAAPLPVDAETFTERVKQARGRVALVIQEIARLVGQILAEHAQAHKKIAAASKAFPAACADLDAQLAVLLPKNFIAATPFERLAHLPRYLKAALLRVDKLRADPARDARLMQEFYKLAQPFERERNQLKKAGGQNPFLEEFRWLLEELRVALFAQELRTPSPVSVKRLQKMWEGRQHG